MGLPKQIRKQQKSVKEIEDYIRDGNKQARGEDPKDVAQAEIDALLEEVTPSEIKEEPAANVTELHPQADEGGDLPSTPEVKPERTDWKQKYSVLKGKYDAEVPRLSQDLRDANARIERLEDKWAANASVPDSEPLRTDFSAEEIADYGEDLLEVIGRKARSIVENEYRPTIDGLKSNIQQLKTQLGETGQKVAKQETNEVFAELDRDVKDWRSTNTDPEFHEWLDQPDPFTGESRKNLLLKAFDRKNAQQVKAFFEKYQQENAAVTPSTADAPPSGQGGTKSRLDLGNYVAPGTPKSGGNAGAPKEKHVWSRSDIGRFYSDIQKGHYKNRPEDRARIEADIVSATKEGRISS